MAWQRFTKGLAAIALLSAWLANGGPVAAAQPAASGKWFGDVEKIAASWNRSFAIKADGTVWGWGMNDGALGNGAYAHPYSPVKLHIADVQAISGAARHTLFLKTDGSVWVAGINENGVFGLGDTKPTKAPEPVKIDALKDIVAISAADRHNMALDRNGTVWVWGSNEAGQLGDPDLQSSARPIRVQGLPPIRQIYATFLQSYAIQEDGGVWAWGMEMVSGGDDPDTVRQPTLIQGTGDVVALAEAGDMVAALCKDGTVKMWRSYTHFTRGETLKPKTVAGLRDVVAISGGGQSFLAVKSDGTVWQWRPSLEQDGIRPERVNGIQDAVAVASGHEHHVVLLRNGQMLAWGSNHNGQLGAGARQGTIPEPVPVTEPVDVRINGSGAELAIPPLIVDGISYVPLRGVFEQIGARVEWRADTRSVHIQKGAVRLDFHTKSGEVLVNGAPVDISGEPFFLNESIMIPLRFVGETLGADVKWDQDQYAVYIETADKSADESA